jgi:hypothetical protein
LPLCVESLYLPMVFLHNTRSSSNKDLLSTFNFFPHTRVHSTRGAATHVGAGCL